MSGAIYIFSLDKVGMLAVPLLSVLRSISLGPSARAR